MNVLRMTLQNILKSIIQYNKTQRPGENNSKAVNKLKLWNLTANNAAQKNNITVQACLKYSVFRSFLKGSSKGAHLIS